MEAVHFSQEDLTEKFSFEGRIRNIVFGLIGVGAILLILGLIPVWDLGHHEADDSHAMAAESLVHTVATEAGGEDGHGGHALTTMSYFGTNFLHSALYFFTICMGAFFFLTIHRTVNSGWETALRRIPEAMVSYLPVGVVSLVLMFFLMDSVYEWLIIPEGVDPLIDTKRAFLNKGSFIIRNIIFFGVWLGAAIWLRRLSVQQDVSVDGLKEFYKSGVISTLFVIFFAVTYSLFFATDWIKSLEPHWFSTIFGIYLFAGSMATAMTVIYLLMYFLRSQGYMKYINDSHFDDVGKYAFGFTVFWGYIWLSQFLLIWYSNIPEEGIYYVKRFRVDDEAYLHGYAAFFYLNIFINFLIPFLALLPRKIKRTPKLFLPIGILLLYGHWHDLFLMIMPGTLGEAFAPGLVMNLGFMILFAGIFLYMVFSSLSKANMVPLKHPYLEESLHHQTGVV